MEGTITLTSNRLKITNGTTSMIRQSQRSIKTRSRKSLGGQVLPTCCCIESMIKMTLQKKCKSMMPLFLSTLDKKLTQKLTNLLMSN